MPTVSVPVMTLLPMKEPSGMFRLSDVTFTSGVCVGAEVNTEVLRCRMGFTVDQSDAAVPGCDASGETATAAATAIVSAIAPWEIFDVCATSLCRPFDRSPTYTRSIIQLRGAELETPPFLLALSLRL